jgi:DUF4097 and DUF4098 domain-containing protein YvlB
MKLITTALLMLFVFAACTWMGEPVSLNERQSLDLTGMTKLEVRGIAGNFTVLRGQNSLLSASGVGRVALRTERAGNTLQIITSGETNCYPCTVEVEIQLAQPLALNLNASNGNITVTDAATSAMLKSGNGSIRISGANTVTAQTANGEIVASKIDGAVNLSSGNGKIRLENSVLPAASQNLLKTKLGDIQVRNVSTEGGFVVSGNKTLVSFELPGFGLQTTAAGFTATRAGLNPTTLRLETDNGNIQVLP